MVLKAVDYDNRGDASVPYGFVYFNDETRCVYAKGAEFDGVSTGTGGWPAITMKHVHEAQRFLAEKLGEGWYQS